MSITFSPAQEGDLNDILSLYKSQIGEKFCAWNEFYPGWEEIQNDFSTQNLFVLKQENTIIGAISIVPENEMDCLSCWQNHAALEFARVAVHKAHQGHGLALLMVENLLPIMKSRGAESIHISAAKGNLPAYKTYIKAGFQVRGEASMYGGEYYLMEKTV